MSIKRKLSKHFIFNFLKNQKGFTLVELMVVVIILGILGGVAVPQYLQRTEQARVSATITSLKAMRDAINLWAAENNSGKYPTTDEVDDALSEGGITWSGAKDGWGQPFTYAIDNDSSSLNSYVLFSKGPDNENDATQDNIVTKNNMEPRSEQGAVDLTNLETSVSN